MSVARVTVMKTITKIIALGAVGAAGVAASVAAVRAFRARRAEQELDISDVDDLGDIEDEPVVVAEEVVIITEASPYEADMEAAPYRGFTPGSR